MTTAIEREIGNAVSLYPSAFFSDDYARKEGDCGAHLNFGSESAPFLPSSGVFVAARQLFVGSMAALSALPEQVIRPPSNRTGSEFETVAPSRKYYERK